MNPTYRASVLVCFLSTVVACAHNAQDETHSLVAPRSGAMSEGEGGEASDAAHLDLAVERAALLAADKTYSDFSAGTNLIDGTMNMVAPDIVYIAPGPYITSSAQLLTLLQSNAANATAVLTWTAVRADVSADATRGYTYGYTEIRLPDGSVVPGKYIAYWARQTNGTWKVRAYRRNVRPAGSVSLTPPPGFETPVYPRYRYFPNSDAATTLATVFAADQAFSDLAQSGVSDACVAYAAPDAAVLSRFAGIGFGADAIAQNQIGAAPGSLIWSPSLGDASESGDLAFTTGIAMIRVQNSDGTWTVTGSGKYLTVWKKQRTGEWRFEIDG
jgi:ketosteroid isomerase-like protein